MKLLDYLVAPAALAGLVATGWWGLYQSPQRPANLAAQLEQDANAALARGGYDWAHVRMNGQRAVLLGAAPSEDAAMAAAETVLHAAWPGGVVVGGVTVVEVAVVPGTPVSPFVWRAEKLPDGSFRLSGHIPSRRIGEQLIAEASRLSGGVSPQNDMKVTAGVPGGNWQGVARFGLETLAETDAGEVRLINDTLRISATETDPAARALIAAQVQALAAPYRGAPLLKGIASWTARHTPEGLVLEGKVRSEADQRDLLGIAQANYSGEVIDRMEIAPDLPGTWMPALRAGLPHFARFSSGEMGLYPAPGDAGLAIEGEAAGSTLGNLSADMAQVAAPMPVALWAYPVDVAVPEVADVDFAADPAAACEQAFGRVLAAYPLVFEGDTAVLSRASGGSLDRLVAVSHLCAPDLLFEIGGHTDSEGDRAANLALSEARAAAVMTYLVSAGFDPDRLSAVGYGPDQPVQSNDSPEGRAANRRIGFTIRTRSE